jgi:hypothetical protein
MKHLNKRSIGHYQRPFNHARTSAVSSAANKLMKTLNAFNISLNINPPPI